MIAKVAIAALIILGMLFAGLLGHRIGIPLGVKAGRRCQTYAQEHALACNPESLQVVYIGRNIIGCSCSLEGDTNITFNTSWE